MKYSLLFLIVLFCWETAITQDENLLYEDHVYVSNIRTVKLHLAGLPLSYPIIDLGSSAKLLLYFDDIDGETKDYVYSVQHCNHDWTPSELSELDYIDGFTEAEINNYEFSYQTYTDFTNYSLFLPNNNFKWTKSGNYLLKVYDEDNEHELVLTRRFMVAEPKWIIEPSMNQPASVNKQQTHQEVDFIVKIREEDKISNAGTEVRASVLQNGRWDNALVGLQARFDQGRILNFDYQDKIVFSALKEWRPLDLRSLNYKTNDVQEIVRYPDGYDVLLKMDQNRAYKAFLSYIEINGNYWISASDFNGGVPGIDLNSGDLQVVQDDGSTVTVQRQDPRAVQEGQLTIKDVQQLKDFNLRSDYALVYFSLEASNELYKKDLYIYGALTDWQLKDEFKLEYDEERQIYTTQAWLKQGYYNYMYAAVSEGNSTIELEEIEGSWYETENDYLIFVYYRPFGQRYDRLVGVKNFSSED